jgi:hypothetical protein
VGGSSFPNRRRDYLYDRLQLLEYLMVPKAKHMKSLTLKPCRSFCVIQFKFGMLTTIEFENKLTLKCDKVHDERANWRLPTKPTFLHLVIPNPFPKTLFRVRHVLS